MSKCKFCNFKLVKKGDEEKGDSDYCEGGVLEAADDIISKGPKAHQDEMMLRLANIGHLTYLSLNLESTWDETIDYQFRNAKGSLTIPSGLYLSASFDINYCPMCGREL